MKTLVKAIPNTLTLGNLISGCVGITFLIKGDITTAVYMIWLSALFDFLDGFAARLLTAYSDIGKQLDSLADMISSGVLPSLLLFILVSENTDIMFLPYVTFSVATFSAIRLARFNLDDSQSINFRGMPTPASALLISGIGIWSQSNAGWFNEISNNPYFLTITCILLSWLMVSKIEFASLKILDYKLKSNLLKILMVLISIILIMFYGLSAVAIIFYLYIVMALARHIIKM